MTDVRPSTFASGPCLPDSERQPEKRATDLSAARSRPVRPTSLKGSPLTIALRVALATLLTGLFFSASTAGQVDPLGTEAIPITCNTTVTGTFASSDDIWSGICSGGQTYAGPVKTYDFQGVAGTTITIAYTSPDIFNDLVLVVSNPPDGADSSCHKTVAIFSYTLPTTGLYKIGAGGSVGGHYSLRLACVSGGTPNLTPYKPTGWSDKVIVLTAADSAAGSTVDSKALTSADSLYFQWAIINNGTGATGAPFYVDVYIDEVAFNAHNFHWGEPLVPHSWIEWHTPMGSLSAGIHTIRVVADSTNAVGETNEGDNEYLKTIVVQGSAPSPTPTPTVTPPATPTMIPRMPVVLLPRKGR